MPHISLKLDGDGAWDDLAQREVDDLFGVNSWQVVTLTGGMGSGKESVGLRVDVPGTKRSVVLQTSLDCWLAAARTMAARYRPTEGHLPCGHPEAAIGVRPEAVLAAVQGRPADQKATFCRWCESLKKAEDEAGRMRAALREVRRLADANEDFAALRIAEAATDALDPAQARRPEKPDAT